jgi:bifunctional DNase/RNase
MSDGQMKVSVSNVRTAVAAGPGVEAGQVTLREDAEPYRSVDIIIGQPEARAIMAAWTGSAPSRPSTWDLFIAGVQALEARLSTVVITAVEEQRYFFATVELDRDGERRVLAARPSDAIALALRSPDAEIRIAESVMDALGMGAPSPHETN